VKAKRITYSECVSVALGIQYAMRMPRIMLSSVVCPTVQDFKHYLITGTIFEESY
jgi:hypothetical protein